MHIAASLYPQERNGCSDYLDHFFRKQKNKNGNESENETGEDTYAGALRAPRAGSPAFVFAFASVFVFLSDKIFGVKTFLA